jgi:hypothetical protein
MLFKDTCVTPTQAALATLKESHHYGPSLPTRQNLCPDFSGHYDLSFASWFYHQMPKLFNSLLPDFNHSVNGIIPYLLFCVCFFTSIIVCEMLHMAVVSSYSFLV